MLKVYWKQGQSLLPNHFQQQEASLIEQPIMRMRMMGYPFHGIGQLSWQSELLVQGLVKIDSLTVIMPSGTLLSVPDNAVINSLDLNQVGHKQVKVFLHLSADRKINDMPVSGGVVQTQTYQLVLSTNAVEANVSESLLLAVIDKMPEGSWQLSQDYIPPLLQVGTTPFLQTQLNQLQGVLALYQNKLEKDLSIQHLNGDDLSSIKQSLLALYPLQTLLANSQQQVHAHPYNVYQHLNQLFLTINLHQGRVPEAVPVYGHNKLVDCLGKMINQLCDLLKVTKQKDPYLAFGRGSGFVSLTHIPQHVRQAKEIYILVQKDSANNPFDLTQYKLASPQRLPLLQQNALPGVRLERILQPKFQHGFGNEVDFYRVREGVEWDHIVAESAISLYDKPELEEMDIFLFWRHS